ncbi:MAG: alpha/beta fold hydrolase [Gammaproteobacteria bacterium]|nr:alpha/beta fold hydrolase [Gammaproteobacteria bacterium]
MRRVWLWGLLALMMACRSMAVPVGDPVGSGELSAQAFVTADGSELTLHRWAPADSPKGVILALHGFNDHGAAFAAISDSLNDAGYLLYAYDQRGFGQSEHAGRWAGHEVMAADARLALKLLRERHPELPLYLLGKSMGGAVAVLAMADAAAPPVDGTLLVSPAVVGEAVMPGHQRLALWLAERLVPGLPLSVELGQALGYRPTDQPEVMAALRDDPLVLDHPTVAAVAGLADLMEAASLAAPRVKGEVLLLYGKRDDLVPVRAVCKLLDGLIEAALAGRWWVRVYPKGYHMLTRYSAAGATRADLLQWLDGSRSLPQFVDPAGGRAALGCDR